MGQCFYRFFLTACAGMVAVAATAAFAAPPGTAPIAGLRQNTPAVHALINARIVPEPGKLIERGTVVLRDGVIEAVGADVKPPPDARTWDLSGKTVYAGLIDAYGEMPVTADLRKEGAAHWNQQVTPQLNIARYYTPDNALNSKLRGQGITVRLLSPSGRIINGQSILVSTGSSDKSRAILRENVAQHLRLTVPFGTSRENYPNSPMGAVALARQTMLDGDWYARTWTAWERNSQLQRPERNEALAALKDCLSGDQPAIIDTASEQAFLRADRFAREFGLSAIMKGSGREYRQLNEVRESGRAVIVPLNFPQPPNVGTLEESAEVTLQQLMHWDHAPENPSRLDQAGVAIAFTSHGLKDQSTFLVAVRRAVERGLKPESALKALTTGPADMFKVSDRLGTIAPGKFANLIVTDGDLFAKKTKIIETWIDGQQFEIVKSPVIDSRGTWRIELTNASDRVLRLNLKIAGTPTQLTGTLQKVTEADKPADEIKLAQVAAAESQLTFRFDGKALGVAGSARATATMIAEGENLTLVGTLVWSDGSADKIAGTRQTAPPDTAKDIDEGKDEDDGEDKDAEVAEASTKKPEPKKPEKPALFPVNYPLGDYGRAAPPEQPKIIAFKNATLWTCGEAGLVEGATLVVAEGKILAAGKDVEIPEGATIVDAAGRHISPGIIDCHSHMATDGGVNESSQAISAEVRIGDFIDPADITIYRQLAGGVTSSNILHGSANPIGGQNQVIKLRWGSTGEQMKFEDAPGGIKFALGENVKQANWGDRFNTRYPQTRMGVEQIIRDALAAATDYQKSWDRWNKNRQGLPPRRDLELEAISEILQKKRWIHCHSYRQDEILGLIRICDEHKITIGSLQHILEGYKVADAMAKHGATGSSFSDWWAYKFEVVDAIPFNGAIMHRAGIVVSFNSDDAELGRHLNHEAAKAVKYGGVEPAEALKFVTLNPAKQLRIDSRVGSLEKGKDADFVLWSGSPLSTMTRCEQTWVDGRKYFDRLEDRALREEQGKMRAALIRKVLDSGQAMLKEGESDGDDADLWPRHDEFCAHGHGHDHEH